MRSKVILEIMVLLSFSALSATSSFGLDKLRVGLGSVSALHGAMWVTEDKGIFRKYGIDAEIIIITGGAAAVSALLAGDIQFLNGAGDSVISANLRGADVVMAASVINKGLQRVMARPEFKSPGDLKGKRIGITRFGTVSHLVLQMLLRKWGMGPNDVQTVQVGSSPAMIVSLEKGGIDAAVLTIPSVFVAEERGYRVLADLADMDIYYLQTMLDSTRAYLRDQREPATRFLKAFIEGIAYFKQNKQESIAVLKKKLRADPNAERYLEKSYDLLAAKYYDRVPYPSLQGVETVLEFLSKDNPKAKGADPKTFVDASIVREIEASGFVKPLYEK